MTHTGGTDGQAVVVVSKDCWTRSTGIAGDTETNYHGKLQGKGLDLLAAPLECQTGLHESLVPPVGTIEHPSTTGSLANVLEGQVRLRVIGDVRVQSRFNWGLVDLVGRVLWALLSLYVGRLRRYLRCMYFRNDSGQR
ncbi:uncharacterized protein G2W53_022107 [Senna tora]|uniref:Uncharacterized protein n=1 Tax=Senna tora TaxID=362788 RepID=A0A834TKN2_9FABA|nr:uncharacterized protein G2W53_022107 [Senna tora]